MGTDHGRVDGGYRPTGHSGDDLPVPHRGGVDCRRSQGIALGVIRFAFGVRRLAFNDRFVA